jgi:hypothetical protein
MTRLLLLLLLLLSGCVSSARPGLTAVRVESKRSTPSQLCRWTPGFQRAVDLALVLTVDELVAVGLVKDRVDLARSLQAEPPIACQIERPEPCTLTPSTCTANAPACARKRGCAHSHGLWLARLWPPLCRESWPDEPHCVNGGANQSERGWESDLVHEIAEMILARVGGDAHGPKALAAQQRASEAYRRAKAP